MILTEFYWWKWVIFIREVGDFYGWKCEVFIIENVGVFISENMGVLLVKISDLFGEIIWILLVNHEIESLPLVHSHIPLR